MKKELKEILAAALAAAEPGRTVRQFLSIEDRRISVGEESFEPRRVLALAIGKASGAMARAAGEVLGETLSGGLCVIKTGHEEPPPTFETLVASHPEPDEKSTRAAEKVEGFLEALEERSGDRRNQRRSQARLDAQGWRSRAKGGTRPNCSTPALRCRR